MTRPVTRTVRGRRWIYRSGNGEHVWEHRAVALRWVIAPLPTRGYVIGGPGVPADDCRHATLAAAMDAAADLIWRAVVNAQPGQSVPAPALGATDVRRFGHTWRNTQVHSTPGSYTTKANGHDWYVRRIDSRGSENGWYVSGPHTWATDPAGDRCETATDAFRHAATLIAEHAARDTTRDTSEPEEAWRGVVNRYATATHQDAAQVVTIHEPDSIGVVVNVDVLADLLDRAERTR